ncbi:MAG: di-trans,poly-cis-decaprenylcistransferase [Gemmatimonadaceae bacterium]
MSQSESSLADLHVAIIMDGNGRWATARGRSRSAGHLAGARSVRRLVEGAREAGLGILTLYAFSGDNWKRPAGEVGTLMRLFRRYLAAETARCVSTGIRLSIIGRRDRLPDQLRHAVDAAESATRDGDAMHLRIAVDYSARDAIVAAASAAAGAAPAALAAGGERARDAFATALGAVCHDAGAVRDVDLLIRTGGEQRLSDFLLWECAYAEFWFTQRAWPDFTPADLAAAIQDFASRNRRFGGLDADAPAARVSKLAAG